jgi:phospholipid transport system substrate-binding protein
VLGKNWGRASAEQREAYTELFPKYVAKLYAMQFSDYSGETFAVKGSKSVSDGTVVNAEINQPRGEPIKLDFIVANTGRGLKVADVKVEGVSLLVTKRSEFDAVVAQNGIDGLIQAMRQPEGERGIELDTSCGGGVLTATGAADCHKPLWVRVRCATIDD